MKIGERVKNMIKSWLDIRPSNGQIFTIDKGMDFEAECIRNLIWYRGDSNELSSFYSQLKYAEDTFWGIAQTADIKMKKSHSGLPKLLIKTIVNTVMTDYAGDDCTDDYWKSVNKENKFDSKMLKEILSTGLVFGDGAIKINYDKTISDKAILEWVNGSKVDFAYKRGRLIEIIFKSYYEKNNIHYELKEHYGYGYVKYHLYKQEKDSIEVPLNTIESLSNLRNIEFDKSIMWAVPFIYGNNSKYPGRGESIFDGKYDSFDSLDEIISQWLDAVRTGRAKTYIPEDLLPRDTETGEVIMSNPFDNRFIATEYTAKEGVKQEITVTQPKIPTENYLASYIAFLDLCLQGIVSPSTLGIDNKKLDNAEAQREKEKTTLYTRGMIIDILSEFIPKVINVTIQSWAQINNKPLPEEKEYNPKFGEYNNPSFEAQVETIGKGKTEGIISIQTCVDELYGDSKDEKWKKEEVERLKAEQGIIDVEEPAVNYDLEMAESNNELQISNEEQDKKSNNKIDNSKTENNKEDK